MSSLLTHNHNDITSSTLTRSAGADDAVLIQHLYAQAPSYTTTVTMKVPSVEEIRQDLQTAEQDVSRYTELVLCPQDEGLPWDFFDPKSKRAIVGYLDYKVDYPQEGDVMINLLLVPEPLQGNKWGTRVVHNLESRLNLQYQRMLASVYGRNAAATRFWQRLGYHHALDAQPIMDWYGKTLPLQSLLNPDHR